MWDLFLLTDFNNQSHFLHYIENPARPPIPGRELQEECTKQGGNKKLLHFVQKLQNRGKTALLLTNLLNLREYASLQIAGPVMDDV